MNFSPDDHLEILLYLIQKRKKEMKLTTNYVVVQLRNGRLVLTFNAVIFNSFETARNYAVDMTEAYATPANELEYVVLRGKDPYND